MKIAIFSRSFYPPTRAHAWIVRRLATLYPRVIVRPRGHRVPGEFDAEAEEHRLRMSGLSLAGIDLRRVLIDGSDVGRPYTQPARIYDELRAAGHEPVLVVGSGFVLNGEIGSSDIQNKWEDGRRLWQEAAFRVVAREDDCRAEDLPPHNDGPVIECRIAASATLVREAYADGNVQAAERQLQPQVAVYVRRNRLFRQTDPSV